MCCWRMQSHCVRGFNPALCNHSRKINGVASGAAREITGLSLAEQNAGLPAVRLWNGIAHFEPASDLLQPLVAAINIPLQPRSRPGDELDIRTAEDAARLVEIRDMLVRGVSGRFFFDDLQCVFIRDGDIDTAAFPRDAAQFEHPGIVHLADVSENRSGENEIKRIVLKGKMRSGRREQEMEGG